MTTTVSDKRRAILDATLELVAENGFHGTAMSQVARRAGVSAGIVYHYFEGKDDLIEALYRDIKSRWSVALMAGNPDALPFPDHLVQLWLNTFHFYASHRLEAAFLGQYEHSPYPHDWDNWIVDENMTRLAGLLHRDRAEGRLKELPLPVMYELTLGAAVALAKQQIAGVVDLDDAQLAGIAAACSRAISREAIEELSY